MSFKWLWNLYAKGYQQLWVQKVSLKPTRKVVLDFLENSLKDNHQVLDVGCGVGELLEDVTKCFPNKTLTLYGLDYAEAMIKEARKKVPKVNLNVLDVHTLDQHYHDLDVILNTHSFPYYKDQQKVMNHFHKALKEHGDLIIAFASPHSFYDRLIMSGVKLTTGSARYLSPKAFELLWQGLFQLQGSQMIRQKAFMPAIMVYHFKKVQVSK